MGITFSGEESEGSATTLMCANLDVEAQLPPVVAAGDIFLTAASSDDQVRWFIQDEITDGVRVDVQIQRGQVRLGTRSGFTTDSQLISLLTAQLPSKSDQATLKQFLREDVQGWKSPTSILFASQSSLQVFDKLPKKLCSDGQEDGGSVRYLTAFFTWLPDGSNQRL